MLRTPGNPPLPVPASLTRCSTGAPRRCARARAPRASTPTADRRRRGGPGAAVDRAHERRATSGRVAEQQLTPPFIDETLRLRPSASAALRHVDGAYLALSSPLAHRDPVAFPAPHAFRPDRDYEHPLYLPFGGGVRRCVGEPLARAQLRAIPPLLPRLRAVHPRPERMVVRGTVLVPHRSALVIAT